MKPLLVLIISVIFLSCDKEDGIINQPLPQQKSLPQIISWQDTFFTGAVRNSTLIYNIYGNPVSVHSIHDGTGSEPDSFSYDSQQRLIEHARLFTYQYLYNADDTMPYAAIEVWPYGEQHRLDFTYDSDQRIIKVVSDYIEGSAPDDEVVGEKHWEKNYTYDGNGNLINDEISSADYSDKPSIYKTNKWWPLIHLDFSNNSRAGADYNEEGLPRMVNEAIFLGLGAGTVGYANN